MKLFALFLSIFCSLLVFSQDESLSFTFNSKVVKTDSIETLDFSTPNKGIVTIIKDQRIASITEFIGRQEESVEGTKIDGFRVQIFFAEYLEPYLRQYH